MMLPPCPTTHAVLLCAVNDERGVLRFPSLPGADGLPGLTLPVKPLLPINDQLTLRATEFFGVDVARRLAVSQVFADEMSSPAGPVTLYLATLDPAAGLVAAATWPTMPEILRQLSGRSRVPYMRAWQVLAGGLALETKAIEATDSELAKHFDN